MLWYKAWRESCVRFFLSAGIIAVMCLLYILFHTRLYSGVIHDHPNVHNYIQYIHWTIFGGTTRGIMQLSCLLLGLGGLQRDRKQNTLGFTLALPASRFALVATRAALASFRFWRSRPSPRSSFPQHRTSSVSSFHSAMPCASFHSGCQEVCSPLLFRSSLP